MRIVSRLSPVRSASSNLMVDLFNDFERVIDDFARTGFADPVVRTNDYHFTEAKDHYLISVDVPGVRKEDLRIELEGDQLWIRGERKSSDGRSAFKYEHTFTVPPLVAEEHIEAHYEDGVLRVALPKQEKAKGRAIPIQSAPEGFFSKLLGSKKNSGKDLKDVETIRTN